MPLLDHEGHLELQRIKRFSLSFIGWCSYPCKAAAPLTISVNSVVMAACLALL